MPMTLNSPIPLPLPHRDGAVLHLWFGVYFLGAPSLNLHQLSHSRSMGTQEALWVVLVTISLKVSLSRAGQPSMSLVSRPWAFAEWETKYEHGKMWLSLVVGLRIKFHQVLVVHACNLAISTLERQARGLMWVQGQPGLHHEILAQNTCTNKRFLFSPLYVTMNVQLILLPKAKNAFKNVLYFIYFKDLL